MPVAAQITTDCPTHIVLVGLPVMVQSIKPFVTILLQILIHPLAFVTVTEYVPAVVTLMQLVVAPVLQR